jgi:hypothetical protein
MELVLDTVTVLGVHYLAVGMFLYFESEGRFTEGGPNLSYP